MLGYPFSVLPKWYFNYIMRVTSSSISDYSYSQNDYDYGSSYSYTPPPPPPRRNDSKMNPAKPKVTAVPQKASKNPQTSVKKTKWWETTLNVFQTVLDVAGLVPGFGEIADGANAGIYSLRGDWTNAALSGAACIPFAGWAATGGKLITKGVKAVKKIDDVADAAKVIGKTTEVIADAGKKASKGVGKNVNVELKYKDGWSAAQKAEADAKVKALTEANTVKAPANRSGTSASSRYKSAYGETSVPKGYDVDHTIDLQLGGADKILNMNPLDMSVNRSLGVQIKNSINNYDIGTVFDKFTIK